MIIPAPPRRRFLAGIAAFAVFAGLRMRAEAAQTPRPAALSPEDRSDLKRIEDYLNGIRTLQSRFQQYTPEGNVASGTIWLERPGKMRIAYDDPLPILIIASEGVVHYWDKKLEQLSTIAIEDTPAWFLLRPKVQLTGDVTVTRFERTPGVFRVSVSETNDPDQGNLTVLVSERPLELRQWTVLDQQHKQVTVVLEEPHYGVALNELLFFWTSQKR